MKRTIYLLLILLILACQSTDSSLSVAKEIAQLQTSAQQKVFLEAIYDLDQQVRKDETAALQQHGYNSPEYDEAVAQWQQVDQENIAKIDAYLEAYGYPTTARHGSKACETPILVIHHAPGNTGIRERHFSHIYQAYLREDVEGGMLAFYLNRMYEQQVGHRLQWDRAFREQEEIDTLIQLMELTPLTELKKNN